MIISNIIKPSVIAVTATVAATGASGAQFNFDDGTNQGWRIFSSSSPTLGPAGFNDSVNYEGNASFTSTDELDGDGAAFGFTTNTAGSSFFNFVSPDLSSDSAWQNLQSFSGQVAQPFASDFDYFAQAAIVIDDKTSGVPNERRFATPGTLLTDTSWSAIGISDMGSLLSGFGVTSYDLKEIQFVTSWSNEIDAELTFALDSVAGIAGSNDPGMSVVPLPAAGWLLLAAIGGLGGLRRRKTA